MASVLAPRIVMTMIATITDPQMKRLTEFATDVAQLADQRPDFDLRELINHLYADLLVLKGDDDG